MNSEDPNGVSGYVLPWPEGWRETLRRARSYEAKGVERVRTVEVDARGFRDTGMLLPMKVTPLWWGALFAILGSFFVFCALVLLVAAFVEGEWGNLVGVLVLGAFGTIFWASVVAVVRRRKDAVPGLRLTPARIVFDGGAAQGPLSIPWDEMDGIRLFTTRYGRRTIFPRPWHNWLSLDVKAPSAVLEPVGHRASARLAQRLRTHGVVAIADSRWRVDAVVAYHAVRFYLDSPDHRRELADDRAVSRLRRRALR
ncbi:hypothetical protein [Phytoactinopolyspora endophytica]|uniref:hypothetical protein n=1 Tax=Phytoactinopolyspora endophytica TaxID=1642495 RepID=UPI00101BEB34|nr:hypothetical protein [Phytoactinopolyspora endophytica]